MFTRGCRRGNAPNDLSRLLFDGNERAVLAGSRIQNAQISVQDRRRPGAAHVRSLAEIAPSEFLPLKIETKKPSRTEESDDTLSISYWRSGAVRIRVMGWLIIGISHSGLPLQSATRTIEAH